MDNKEKVGCLLTDIKELEALVAGMQEADAYPVSFFNLTFGLTHKILNDLHELEKNQLEALQKQMEEHQALICSIPRPAAKPQPAIPEIAEPLPPSPPSFGPAEKQPASLYEALGKQRLSD
ncbi:MAG: hypothetical protein LBU37_00635, partial [Tannerellaceae bacterium]|nr:hypothetical protein [Tannerellaceae bacterium]